MDSGACASRMGERSIAKEDRKRAERIGNVKVEMMNKEGERFFLYHIPHLGSLTDPIG